ncbi:MAG: DUF6029 family protein [Calditrichaceae bacterium]
MPDTEPANRTALYDQLNLNYYYQNIIIGGRLEYFYTANQDIEYTKLQQKYIQYQNDHLEIKLGNFYEILGQGLVLRTYEIPGVIYEEAGSRQQYAFYKDIEGALIKYYTSWLNLKVLYGYPLDLLQPPLRDRNIRRPNLVQGGELNFTLLNYFSPGVIYLRSNNNNGNANEYSGFNFAGNIGIGLQYYLEYVVNAADQDAYFKAGSSGRHALYGSISQTFNQASFSFEIKDYHDFTLNFNDPPTLVREHARTLLNRGTHIIQPLDERGYQFEAILNIGGLNTITANHAYTENDFNDNIRIFREYYLGLEYYITKRTLTKFFIDRADDPIVNIHKRWTGGALVDQQLSGRWSTILDIQAQRFKRIYNAGSSFDHTAYNYLADFAVSYSPNISAGINIEAAHDPLESDTLFELNKTDYQYWIGWTINYQYSQDHTLALFYGKRRGGNACSGGICYEVQPFEGFELKLNSIL